jgi:hypothetical protein
VIDARVDAGRERCEALRHGSVYADAAGSTVHAARTAAAGAPAGGNCSIIFSTVGYGRGRAKRGWHRCDEAARARRALVRTVAIAVAVCVVKPSSTQTHLHGSQQRVSARKLLGCAACRRSSVAPLGVCALVERTTDAPAAVVAADRGPRASDPPTQRCVAPRNLRLYLPAQRQRAEQQWPNRARAPPPLGRSLSAHWRRQESGVVRSSAGTAVFVASLFSWSAGIVFSVCLVFIDTRSV